MLQKMIYLFFRFWQVLKMSNVTQGTSQKNDKEARTAFDCKYRVERGPIQTGYHGYSIQEYAKYMIDYSRETCECQIGVFNNVEFIVLPYDTEEYILDKYNREMNKHLMLYSSSPEYRQLQDKLSINQLSISSINEGCSYDTD